MLTLMLKPAPEVNVEFITISTFKEKKKNQII